jgi:E3 ubiquitin-protein ligase SHPRH
MNSSDLCFISRDNKVPIDRHEVIEVKGSWGTKLENVVRKILSIIAKEKDAKVLVFSQWNDVLILMARALQENQIKFVNLLGGKKRFRQNLEIFRSIADLKVLLLPIKSGSNGLNLIEATHVILIEPCINPSLEAQAIGLLFSL